MRSCKYEKRIPLFAGGDLPWWQEWWMTRHVRRCERCRSALQEYERLRRRAADFWQQMTADAPADAFWNAVRAEILAEERHPLPAPGTAPVWRPLLYLAAGAAMLLLLWRFEDRAARKLAQKSPPQVVSVRDAAPQIYPIVERVDMPNTTVMTFRTEDPNVTVVWFFPSSTNTNP